MKNLIFRFYVLGIAIALIVIIGMTIEYRAFKEVVVSEVKENIVFARENITHQVLGRLTEKSQVIRDAGVFVRLSSDDSQRLDYFEALLKDNPTFASIYFGSIDNVMINGSGWMPPVNFDLRTRPWYVKAVQEDALIYTSAFLNASKDHVIVTIAQPVYGENQEMLGVIAGDIQLDAIIQMINNQVISNNGYSFLIDAQNNLIAHPKLAQSAAVDLYSVDDISTNLAGILASGSDKPTLITLDGVNGYLSFGKIPNTDWTMASFIPEKVYFTSNRQLLATFLLTILAVSLMFGLFSILQRLYIINPLYAIDKDIRKIVQEGVTYRLPESENDAFNMIRKSINLELEKTEGLFVALSESESHVRAILNIHPDIIFVISSLGDFLEFQTNPVDQQLFARMRAYLGKNVFEVMPADVARRTMIAIEHALDLGDVQSFDYSLVVDNVTKYYEARFIRAANQNVVCIVRDITERQLNLMLIEKLSYRDQLTGLYNRRFFDEESRRLDTARSLPLSLVLIDVNGLKLTNDAFGHLMGDALLRRVSSVLQHCFRAEDIIARFGGDEFVVLLPSTNRADTEIIVNRIYQSIEDEDFGAIKLSVSIGYETKTIVEESLKDIFIKAEDHMYSRKLNESQRMRYQTVKGIIDTLNGNSEVERHHASEVGRLSRLIGEMLDLTVQELKDLENGAKLHDIGKISIKDEILNKPDVLTESEYIDIKRHTESGYQILKSVNLYTSIADIALSHHERWDGLGYPQQLSGEAIPKLARIVAVADAFEAMVSYRPYRAERTRLEAIEEIANNAGTQFDPVVVEAFLKII
jgi:diguanylate cyclase (GGDEF)-like protein